MRIAKILLALATLTTLAVAQEGPPHPLQGSTLDNVALPGQFWSTNGNLEPVEHANVFSMNYAEQGATVFSTWSNSLTLTPFVGIGFSADTKGYSYNNKIDPSIGIKFNKYFRSGVISVGTAYLEEHRFYNGGSASGREDFAQYWFGWEPISESKGRFPGNSWGAVGLLSPVEHGNWIFMDNITQGFVAKRYGAAKTNALMPYAELTVSKDTKGFDWENKIIEGAGVKYGMPKGEFYTEFGAGYIHEDRFNSGLSSGGVKVFVNFSYAWNLFGRKAR